jgi:hypothetical protein
VFSGDGENPYTPYMAWKRAPAFNNAEALSVFSGTKNCVAFRNLPCCPTGIDPVDISQGRLGNCWFICAVSSVAEEPNLVENLFVTQDVSSAGRYVLRWLIHSQHKPRPCSDSCWF